MMLLLNPPQGMNAVEHEPDPANARTPALGEDRAGVREHTQTPRKRRQWMGVKRFV